MRKPLAGLLAAITSIIISLTPALGSNWGALDEEHRCTTDEFSQCTANNNFHWVWISTSLPNSLESALENSLANDFDVVAGITAESVASYDSTTDVHAFNYTSAPTSWTAMETCAGFATFGGSGIRRWCKPHLLYMNTGFHWNDLDDPNERKHYACHELGHTLGLRHTSSTSSCMKDQYYAVDLSSHDITQHLEPEY